MRVNVLANVRGKRTRKKCYGALFSFHSSESVVRGDCIEVMRCTYTLTKRVRSLIKKEYPKHTKHRFKPGLWVTHLQGYKIEKSYVFTEN